MRKPGVTPALLAGFLAMGPLLAGCLIDLPAAGAQPADPAVAEVLSAVVAVESKVPASARTAPALGTERAGSGVVIDGDGLIVTIGYLILEASEVTVTALGGEPTAATVVAYDHATGFGLIRAKRPLGVTPMPLGRSSAIADFERLLVTAFGGVHSVRPAIAVSRREFAGYWEYLLDEAIFTSPPYPVFGGAALVDGQGRLVGIGSLAVGDALRGERVLPGNMFVPIDALKSVMGDLLSRGRSGPSRPWIGIYSSEMEGLVVVQRVAEDGPAARAGVRAGDVIVEVEGVRVNTLAGLYRALWNKREPGDRVTLKLLRGDEPRSVSVKTGDRYAWLNLKPAEQPPGR
jgi:S1-C subfamily serine protease